MSKNEIIKALQDKNTVLGTIADFEAFAKLYADYEFTNDIELSMKYGSYYISKYGKQVTVEWDSEKEGFNTL